MKLTSGSFWLLTILASIAFWVLLDGPGRSVSSATEGWALYGFAWVLGMLAASVLMDLSGRRR